MQIFSSKITNANSSIYNKVQQIKIMYFKLTETRARD